MRLVAVPRPLPVIFYFVQQRLADNSLTTLTKSEPTSSIFIEAMIRFDSSAKTRDRNFSSEPREPTSWPFISEDLGC